MVPFLDSLFSSDLACVYARYSRTHQQANITCVFGVRTRELAPFVNVSIVGTSTVFSLGISEGMLDESRMVEQEHHVNQT